MILFLKQTILKNFYWILLMVCFIFWSCRETFVKNPPPAHLISESEMISILAEIHINLSKANQMNFQSIDSSDAFRDYYQGKIFKNYKIDSTIFAENYKYYSEDLSKLKVIFDKVQEKITQEEKKK